MLTGFTSTPTDGAKAWIAPHWPIPAVMVGSRRTAARVTFGAISLSSSSHFPLMRNSNRTNPVVLPPGRAKLSTYPAPTGSVTFTNTIGTLRVACSSGPTVAVPGARMASGSSAISSAAFLRMSSARPVVQRYSIWRLRPTVQPDCSSPCRNAALRAWPWASFASYGMIAPMRRIRWPCCALAAIGHAAAPPTSAIKSRRFIRSPRRRGRAAWPGCRYAKTSRF
jgi:hypothetical protein